MAVLALSTDMRDMRDRLGRMVVGNDTKGACRVVGDGGVQVHAPCAAWGQRAAGGWHHLARAKMPSHVRQPWQPDRLGMKACSTFNPACCNGDPWM